MNCQAQPEFENFKEPKNRFQGIDSCAGSSKPSMGSQEPSRNRVIVPARQATQAGGIHSLEWIPVLHKRLKVRARDGIFKLLRSRGIDPKEITPAYIAWRDGTRTLFLLCSQPPQTVLKFQHRVGNLNPAIGRGHDSRVGILSTAMGRGIDSRNRVWI